MKNPLLRAFILSLLILFSTAFIVEYIILPNNNTNPQHFPISSNITIEQVTITAYSPSKHITDNTPFEIASGKIVKPYELDQLRYIAVSRDILKKYNIKWGILYSLNLRWRIL